MIETIVFLIEIFGTIAFALSGALRGIEKKLDLLGITILGITAATGGGLLRDILLGIHPPLLFVNPIYAIIAFLASLITFIVVYISNHYQYKFKNDLILSLGKILNFVDAVGLGLFAVVGTDRAIQCGYGNNIFFTIFIGITTGVGGGMIRDILVGETPFFLKKHIYFLAALSGSLSYFYLIKYDVNNVIAMAIGSSITFIIRMLATKYRWNLPKINPKSSNHYEEIKQL